MVKKLIPIAVILFSSMVGAAVIKIPEVSALSRSSALALDSGEYNPFAAVIDAANGFAYFGTQTSPGVIIKVRLSDFTRVGTLTLDENYPFT